MITVTGFDLFLLVAVPLGMFGENTVTACMLWFAYTLFRQTGPYPLFGFSWDEDRDVGRDTTCSTSSPGTRFGGGGELH